MLKPSEKFDNIIALIGFSGTGKSTIAEILHEKLQAPVLEMDEEIVKQCSMSINQIFERYGEKYFRELETKLLSVEVQNPPKIISTGGGVVEKEANRTLLQNSSITVALLASPEEILSRLQYTEDRPLLKDNDRLAKIEKLLARRQKLYESADYLINTDGKTPEQVSDEILDVL